MIVLGSTLGGLVAATYLAREGLRVVLIEEEAHAKRPPALREPFLLPGLGRGGSLRGVLQELAVPLLDQREFERQDISLQVILPEARIDVRPSPGELAAELDAYELASVEEAEAWLQAVAAQSQETRSALWQELAAGRSRSLGSALGRPLGGSLSRALLPPPVRSALPAPPVGAAMFVAAQLAALSGIEPGDAAPAPALLLDGARGACLHLPRSGAPFLDLFRRRFLALHGQIWPVDELGLVPERGQVGIELERTRFVSRALVIAVPREPLRQFLEQSGKPPAWLEGGLPVLETRSRLFRAERAALPVGLAARVIVASRMPGQAHQLAVRPDPEHDTSAWLVASGPGAAGLEAERALGDLAPFAGSGIIDIDSGPLPRWDLDASEVRFPLPESPAPIRRGIPVASVGPELTPGLGVEGEVLQARRVAIRLANLLGSPRALC